jgi:hypothetical protein
MGGVFSQIIIIFNIFSENYDAIAPTWQNIALEKDSYILNHSRIPTSTALLMWNRRPPKCCLSDPNMQYVSVRTCEPSGTYCTPTDHVVHKAWRSHFTPNLRTIQNILGTTKAAFEGDVNSTHTHKQKREGGNGSSCVFANLIAQSLQRRII